MIPTIIETWKGAGAMVGYDIYSRLLRDRIIFIGDQEGGQGAGHIPGEADHPLMPSQQIARQEDHDIDAHQTQSPKAQRSVPEQVQEQTKPEEYCGRRHRRPDQRPGEGQHHRKHRLRQHQAEQLHRRGEDDGGGDHRHEEYEPIAGPPRQGIVEFLQGKRGEPPRATLRAPPRKKARVP